MHSGPTPFAIAEASSPRSLSEFDSKTRPCTLKAIAPTASASEHTWFKMRPNQSKLRLVDRSKPITVFAVSY